MLVCWQGSGNVDRIGKQLAMLVGLAMIWQSWGTWQGMGNVS